MNSLVLHSLITSTWKPGRPLRENSFPPFPQHFLTSPNSLLPCFLFFYLSPACFVLHSVTCKWIHCLRWQNLSHSQEWWSTPSGMMGGESEVQHTQFIHLYLSIGIFVPLLACARLFTFEMERIFIHYNGEWLNLFDLLHTRSVSKNHKQPQTQSLTRKYDVNIHLNLHGWKRFHHIEDVLPRWLIFVPFVSICLKYNFCQSRNAGLRIRRWMHLCLGLMKERCSCGINRMGVCVTNLCELCVGVKEQVWSITWVVIVCWVLLLLIYYFAHKMQNIF